MRPTEVLKIKEIAKGKRELAQMKQTFTLKLGLFFLICIHKWHKGVTTTD